MDIKWVGISGGCIISYSPFLLLLLPVPFPFLLYFYIFSSIFLLLLPLFDSLVGLFFSSSKFLYFSSIPYLSVFLSFCSDVFSRITRALLCTL